MVAAAVVLAVEKSEIVVVNIDIVFVVERVFPFSKGCVRSSGTALVFASGFCRDGDSMSSWFAFGVFVYKYGNTKEEFFSILDNYINGVLACCEVCNFSKRWF